MNRTHLKSKKQLQSKKGLQSKSILKSKSLNGKSKLQEDIEDEYRRVKKELFDSQEQLCSGCRSSFSCTPSHLIPRSRRRDLITDKRNIKPHCNECHPKWESPRRIQLLDYEENMEIVKELDYEYYMILKRDERSE